jgi:hypothetical protein
MIAIVIAAAVFMTGAAGGVVASVCVSIGCEDSRSSLYRKPPTRATAATRRLLGWHGPLQASPAGQAPQAVTAARRPGSVRQHVAREQRASGRSSRPASSGRDLRPAGSASTPCYLAADRYPQP